MEPPPPSYEEVVEGKSDLAVMSSFQSEKERLERAKKQAVENEDYDCAKQLKEELENLIKKSGQMLVLEEKKRKAVEDEDYALAQQLKKEIEALKIGKQSSEVICYELGQGSGFLLHVKVPVSSSSLLTNFSSLRPTPVIVLDRSLSMKGSCRWAITVAVPSALMQLGYADNDRCVLLTFDSVVERVKLLNQDPMLRDLWTIDVSARGKTTMLASVFEQLRLLIQPLCAYNVFVISDGFVHDMQHVRPCVRDITQQGVTSGSRVSFALFRFFNGTPPDTAALAAVASVGNDGGSPCMDCIPPMEWRCARGHATSFRKTVCDSCNVQLSRNNVGINGEEPLSQFCATATLAFSSSLHPHCRIRPHISRNSQSKKPLLMRVPFASSSSSSSSFYSAAASALAAESGLDLPCGKEVLLALSEPITDVLVGENKMSVSVFQGLPPEQKVADFCAEALAQLRLWAVGGVRKKHFSEAIEWFRRFARLCASAGKAEGNHVIVRAWSIRKRVEEGESALGRICSLGDADTFVSKLNSKQQGDFLRGASVARSERALSRRALGSDISFHDAVRTAVSGISSIDSMQDLSLTTFITNTTNNNNKNNSNTVDIHSGCRKETKEEQQYVSYYGGGTYSDALSGAGVMSRCTEDLLTSDILEIVGGLGVAFCFGSGSSGSNSNSSISSGAVSKNEGEQKSSASVVDSACLGDSLWEWEMSVVDSKGYVSEADVWAARANGEPLCLAGKLVGGVIPLSTCDSAAHASYMKLLAPVALMHIGSQLHCSPAKEAWGWDPLRPPYSLEEGMAAREAAALRCLLCNCVGTSKVPSASESQLVFALLSQFEARSSLIQANKHIEKIFDSWTNKYVVVTAPSSLFSSPFCLTFAITVWNCLHFNNNEFDPLFVRRLYIAEINEQASKNKQGLIVNTSPTPQQNAQRNELLVNLLAVNPETQRLVLTEEKISAAVEKRMNGQDFGNGVLLGEEENVRLADASVVLQRLPLLVPFLSTSPLLVFGLYRMLVARKTASELNPASDCLRMLPSHNADIIWFGKKQASSFHDLFPALVIATKLSTSYAPNFSLENFDSPVEIMKELKKVLEISVRNDYLQRLNVAVATHLQAKRLALEKSLQAKSGSSSSSGDVAKIDLAQLEAICNVTKGARATPNIPLKPRVSVVLCGDCNSGKSSLVGRVLLEMGRLNIREVRKLFSEAEAIGKSSYVLAHTMDILKSERERGLSIVLNKTWIETTRFLTTLLDTPGHTSYTSNMLRGIAQGDVGVLVVPADAQFDRAVAKANPGLFQKQGAARTHAHFLYTSGVKQLVILINKMDVVNFDEKRFLFCCEEVKSCLKAVGWKSEEKTNSSFAPLFLPVSGFYGDNIVYPSSKMPWWTGQQVALADGSSGTVRTFIDALDQYVLAPPREIQKPFRLAVSGVLKLKGVGDVLTGRVEQGAIETNSKMKILGRPKQIQCNLVSIETHHTSLHKAQAGDIIGMGVKNLVRDNMPEVGDVVVLEEEKHLSVVHSFVAQVLVEHHGHVVVGYSPLCIVRTARHCVKVTEILWKQSSNGERVQKPPHLTRGDFAEVLFETLGTLVLDTFTSCQGLSRVIFLDGSDCAMIGKVVKTTPLAQSLVSK